METISGKARRHLKALGHHLQPVVLVGKEGPSDALVAAIKRALTDHELIKVKLGENVEGERKELAASLAASSNSELVGTLGRTLLLYKRHPKKPKIVLPDGKATKAANGQKVEPKGAAGKTGKSTRTKGKLAAGAKAPSHADEPSSGELSDEDAFDGEDGGIDEEDDDGDFGDEG